MPSIPVSIRIRNGEQRKRKIKGFIFDIYGRKERLKHTRSEVEFQKTIQE